MRSDLFVRRRRGDVLMPVLLVGLAAGLVALVSPMLTRPLWYNEQWRAWHLAKPGGLFSADPETNAPIAFGYAALTRLSTAVLGQTELALRLPGAVALAVLGVVAYHLARRWVGPLAAALTVTALLANRMVLTYGAELAPYTVEAACTVAVVLLWLGAQDEGRTVRRRWLRYGGIALLALVATPVAFVLAPLLLVDFVRAIRSRDLPGLVPSILAGVVTLLHLVLYVGRQTLQAHGDYWRDGFVPRSLGGGLRAVWTGLASYVPNALTGGTAHVPSTPDGEIAFPGAARAVLIAVMVGLVVAGLVLAFRDPRLRALPIALLGAFGMQVLASLLHYWPLPFSRVNTFLLPLAYVLVAVGVVRIGAALWPDRGYDVASVAGAAAYVLVVAVAMEQVATVRREAPRTAFAADLAGLVDTIRGRASDEDVTVLVHSMAAKGWHFYMRHPRSDAPGVSVPPERTLTVDGATPDVAALRAFLDRYPNARRVYVGGLRGTAPAAVLAVMDVTKERGYAQSQIWRAETGSVRELSRP